jgi:hypothetical protein
MGNTITGDSHGKQLTCYAPLRIWNHTNIPIWVIFSRSDGRRRQMQSHSLLGLQFCTQPLGVCKHTHKQQIPHRDIKRKLYRE